MGKKQPRAAAAAAPNCELSKWPQPRDAGHAAEHTWMLTQTILSPFSFLDAAEGPRRKVLGSKAFEKSFSNATDELERCPGLICTVSLLSGEHSVRRAAASARV